MFDDLLGRKKTTEADIDKDSLIRAMEDNIKQKQEIIDDLIKQVTELERQIETQESGVI